MAKTNIQSKTRVEIKYPDRFKVIILNDDYTPFEFVIQMLIEVFITMPKLLSKKRQKQHYYLGQQAIHW